LWTIAVLSVDGLNAALREFRKSHHLIPAGPNALGIATGGRASACTIEPPRAYQQIEKKKVETACPCSKASSIPTNTL
jgi:hypothetical protein